MGLVSDLGYEVPQRNWFHGLVQKLFSTSAGAWLGYYVVPPIDRLALRFTSGRGTVTQWFAGIAPIWLTTIGAKSGLERETPLFGIPVNDDLALLGTGFGQKPTPAWVYNLEANPSAAIAVGSQRVDVEARPATEAESDLAWDAGGSIYPGFPKYRTRVTDRKVRVFILEPV